MRLLCFFLGHLAGAKLFRYARVPKSDAQWPNKRGRVGFIEVGYSCSRCGRKVEKP